MSTKQLLMQELDQAYAEYRSIIQDMDERTFDTKWLDNQWGVREITAHITGWHGKLASGLEHMSRGERPVPEGENWNEPDQYNEVFAAHAKGKVRDEVLSELEAAVQAFKNAAAKLPDDRFGEGKTANKMFDGAGIGHFREHMEMVREWIGQPAVR